jgi:hypothetical protein
MSASPDWQYAAETPFNKFHIFQIKGAMNYYQSAKGNTN